MGYLVPPPPREDGSDIRILEERLARTGRSLAVVFIAGLILAVSMMLAIIWRAWFL